MDPYDNVQLSSYIEPQAIIVTTLYANYAAGITEKCKESD